MLEGHVARRRAARGSWGSGKRPVKAAVKRREKQREGGAGGRRRGLVCNFPKM
jgi:hypothetical protein